MSETQDEKLVFLHIPKTGGTSIRKAIRGTSCGLLKHRGFSRKTLSQRLRPYGPRVLVFAVVRDPVSRVRSAYGYLRYGAGPLGHLGPRDTRDSKRHVLPFGDNLQEFVMGGGFGNAFHRQVHFKPQCLWVRNSRGETHEACHLLPFEDMETALNKFLVGVGRDTVRLPRRNATTSTVPEGALDMDSQALGVVRRVYADDLRLWRHAQKHA